LLPSKTGTQHNAELTKRVSLSRSRNSALSAVRVSRRRNTGNTCRHFTHSEAGATREDLAEEAIHGWYKAVSATVSRLADKNGAELAISFRWAIVANWFLDARRHGKAHFIEPMLLQRTEKLSEGGVWSYELKLDSFRAVAFKTAGRVQLRSRNDKDFNARYPSIVQALAAMPNETVIDGEIVALDEAGRPSFSALQNGASVLLIYYVFDVMILAGKDVTTEPLNVRRELLQTEVLAHFGEPIRKSPELEASLRDFINSVKTHGLEGLVAKRRDSRYEPGQRSGTWQKMRVNKGQPFVVGGYTPSARNFDALVFGYFDGGLLMYAGRTRSGFTPASRDQVFRRFKGLETETCPFANLPEGKGGRWGEGLTAEKMQECRRLKPALVGEFEFVDWTADGHLRHSRFVALRDDKKARDVRREG
jgi:DNA ligase D-like protein (predicted ligase)